MITNKEIIYMYFKIVQSIKENLEKTLDIEKIYIPLTNINLGTIYMNNENGVLNFHIQDNKIDIDLIGKKIDLNNININDIIYITINENIINDIEKTLNKYAQKTKENNTKGFKTLMDILL